MFNETDFGYEYKTHEYIIFFGKKNCSIENLIKLYSKIEFRNIKQTHSEITVESKKNIEIQVADSHFTSEKNTGLLIKTADCLPILIFFEKSKTVLAIHAGWRGVENQITQKAIDKLNLNEPFKVFIGPHILKDSFEVDADVNKLLLSAAFSDTSELSFFKNEKYYIDLQKIVESQIQNVSKNFEIYKLNLDTFNNSKFNSFRTDKTQDRNLSFIARI